MGDPGASLAEVFVKVDDMMMQPEAAAELLALRDGSLGAPGGPKDSHCKTSSADRSRLDGTSAAVLLTYSVGQCQQHQRRARHRPGWAASPHVCRHELR